MTVLHPAPSSHRARASGFTLIEVMIVVAIVAILASIAIPSYRNYILRGEIAEGTTAVAAYQAQMERHFQDNRTYATSGTRVTPCATTPNTTRRVGNWQIACGSGTGAPDGDSFVVTATGQGTVNNFTFSINEQNGQSSTFPSSWGPNGTTNCNSKWITKKGMAC